MSKKRWLARVAAVGAAVAVSVGLLTAPASAGVITDTTLWISNNSNTNACLDTSGGVAHANSCAWTANQEWILWSFQGFSDNERLMYNVNSGKCLAAIGYTYYTQPIEKTCNMNDTFQQWFWNLETGPNGYGWQLQNWGSGWCLRDPNGSVGVAARLDNCNDYATDTQWVISQSP